MESVRDSFFMKIDICSGLILLNLVLS